MLARPWSSLPYRLLLVGAALALAAGCAKQKTTDAVSTLPSAPNAVELMTPPSSPSDQADVGAEAHPELARKVEELQAAYQKNPKDAATKQQLVEAAFRYGHTVMYDPQLPPRKYRTALKQFRLVLQLDPAHKQAAKEKQTIEAIYRQMGRPIPE